MPVIRKKVDTTIPLQPPYLGVDPGSQGGLALIFGPGPADVDLQPLKKLTERDLWDIISGYPVGTTAVIEQVQGYIGGAHPGSSMFKFGTSYGGLRMALIAAGIPFMEVTPQKWQKAVGIPPKRKGRTLKVIQALRNKPGGAGCCERYANNMACDCLESVGKGAESSTEFKNRLKAKAQQYFPGVGSQITLATADALLLAYYCRYYHLGKVGVLQ